jgi:tetratricopeptide (TPR) repeat protein
MFPRVKAVSVLAAGLLAIAASAPAQQPFRSTDPNSSLITVRVLDERNNPIADARVEVRSYMGMQNAVAGYTNSTGVYQVIVPYGQYEVLAQKAVAHNSERVEVNVGGSLVALKLDMAQTSDVGTATSVSLAQYQVPKKARDEYKKAQSALDKRDLDEAAKRIAKALEICPDFSEALTTRGILRLEAQDNAGAIEDLDHAVKADPGYAMAYFVLGAAFNRAEKFDDALRVLERGIALSPRSWQAQFEIGKAHMGKTNYMAAIKALDKADELANGSYPLLHLVKAHAMLALKQYGEAMNELQVYLTKDPNSAQSENARQTLDQVKAYVAQQ